MANHGKRMVKEYLIAEIGQGGGTEYSAGTGIDITEDVISVDTNTIQEKLTAGENITIEDGVISATGGSVEIDEQTIVADPVTGKIETAVGGYKEETIVTLPDCELTGTYDFDEYDSEKAQELYDTFQVNVEYPCSVTFTNMQTTSTWTESTFTVTGYIKSASKDASKFGGDPALFVTYNDNEYGMEFYVEPSSNRIHVYGGNVGLYPDPNGGTVEINLGDVTVTTYHKIDKNYLDIPEYEAGVGIKIENGEISVLKTAEAYNPVQQYTSGDYFGYSLNYDKGQFKADQSNGGKLQTTFGGGYGSTHQIDKTTYSQVSGGTWDTWYESSDSDTAELIATYFKNYIINERASDITANNTFDVEITTIEFQGPSWSSMPNARVNVSVGNDGETVTVTGNTGDQLSIDGFVFNFTTQAITTNATKVYYNDWLGASVLTNADPVNIVFKQSPEYANIVEKVDNKFLPAFDNVPTLAGTYTLQATVDAQGNVTYSWVTVTP